MMYPEDPSQPFYTRDGKYLQPLCLTCPSYSSTAETKTQVIYKRRPVDDEIDQLRAGLIYADTKLNEHIDIAKKRAKQQAATRGEY